MRTSTRVCLFHNSHYRTPALSLLVTEVCFWNFSIHSRAILIGAEVGTWKLRNVLIGNEKVSTHLNPQTTNHIKNNAPSSIYGGDQVFIYHRWLVVSWQENSMLFSFQCFSRCPRLCRSPFIFITMERRRKVHSSPPFWSFNEVQHIHCPDRSFYSSLRLWGDLFTLRWDLRPRLLQLLWMGGDWGPNAWKSVSTLIFIWSILR